MSLKNPLWILTIVLVCLSGCLGWLAFKNNNKVYTSGLEDLGKRNLPDSHLNIMRYSDKHFDCLIVTLKTGTPKPINGKLMLSYPLDWAIQLECK